MDVIAKTKCGKLVRIYRDRKPKRSRNRGLAGIRRRIGNPLD